MDLRSRFDTEDICPADRFAYWRESVCESFVRLGCEAENRRDFRGLIETSRHSVLSISNVTGAAHRVERRRKDIRVSSDDYFLLSLQTSESATVSQFGKRAVLRPGDMALYYSADPYTLELSNDFSQTVVQLPAAKLISRLPNAEMLTARTIDGQSGLGKLVRDNILAFAEHVNTADPTLQSLLQDTLVDLIATGLAAHRKDKVELSSPEQHVMLRAKAFIRGQLDNCDLDRNMVAAEMGMSVRRLNDVFAKEGSSLSAFIRKARLEGVASDLGDRRFDGLSISEIALRYGFSNLQNFSTVFRTHFGQSPRDFREHSKI